MTVAEREPREIVAGLLADRRLLAACAERDMGTLFRLLNHRGISTRRIAAAVDITQGRLYDYMNGKSRVEKLAIFEQIADAFQIPGHLLGLAKRAEEVLDSASEAERPWLSPFDAAALALESALVLSDLRRHDEARTRAEHAIHLRESNRARSLALSRITLTELHLRCDDVEAAVAVSHDVLTADPNLGSIRVLCQLDGLHTALAVHRSHPPVRALLQRFDETRRARMLLLADIVPPPSKGATP
ncbi:helix-turn-helix domain-containing protein [Streptomyces sp. NPDC088197]|uniref:helix-turn-helix domain-containing protein n=1 Tax=Streptomyces sp. NPDC088197 TaxID=3365840 RepID=UPI003826D69E